MSVIGKWAVWNASDEPAPYGKSLDTYEAGAQWLADCALVEDWGCGRGFMTTLIPPERYRGVDGASPFAAVVADLTSYRSDVDGVFLRHVLEHNDNWRAILDNAVSSARVRLFIAVFTPLAETTHRISYAPNPGCPDISFALADLVGPISAAGFECDVEILTTDTQYGTETVLRCKR